MDIKNKRISDDEFNRIRAEVLTQWPTGKDVDFQEAVEYQKSIPAERRFAEKLIKAKREGRTLTQPRAGVALINEHIELLQHLQDAGEADLLPTTIDSYTRQNRYEDCENGIRVSQQEGRSMLNGFPAVNHGVQGCRRVIEALKTPVQVRHGTPDARLLAEITYAGGFTSYEGGGISYNLPYTKNVPMERTIRDWQYVDRLTGIYEEAGVSINREPYGPLTGTLVPPCISHAVAVIEALLAAEQGVKNVTVGFGQGGNLLQDIAAIRSLEELTNEYLEKYGYNDVVVTTVFHQWMGGFPQDEAKAFGVISWVPSQRLWQRPPRSSSRPRTKRPVSPPRKPTRPVCAARSRPSPCWLTRTLATLIWPKKRTSSSARPAASSTSATNSATAIWQSASAEPSKPALWTYRSHPAASTPARCCPPETTTAPSASWNPATCRSPRTSRTSTERSSTREQSSRSATRPSRWSSTTYTPFPRADS